VENVKGQPPSPLPCPAAAALRRNRIGWHFHPADWGNGYATEAAQTVLDYAFERRLPRVVAVTTPASTASQRVCSRIGLALFYAADPSA
jgi:RimJ/RimL family protein N-acetyltransferase